MILRRPDGSGKKPDKLKFIEPLPSGVRLIEPDEPTLVSRDRLFPSRGKVPEVDFTSGLDDPIIKLPSLLI